MEQNTIVSFQFFDQALVQRVIDFNELSSDENEIEFFEEEIDDYDIEDDDTVYEELSEENDDIPS